MSIDGAMMPMVETNLETVRNPTNLFVVGCQLGSGKDYEDARYLYTLLLQYIDLNKLRDFISALGVEKEAKKILGV